MRKNTTHTVLITALSAEGNAIAHLSDGYTVFVPGGTVGDTLKILIVKEKKTYGFGKILEIINPSENRIDAPCPAFSKCGGCDLQQTGYKAQLEFKQKKVEDAFLRIGGFKDFLSLPIEPSPKEFYYRNKAQYPAAGKAGEVISGFYAPHSHRVVSSRRCLLQDSRTDEIRNFITDWINEKKIPPYDEESGSGILRKICVRCAKDEACVVLVCKKSLPHKEELGSALTERFPFIKGVIENINAQNTNIIYGEKENVISGRNYIYDNIGALRFKINYKSFFQVNPYTTRLLYDYVREKVKEAKSENVFDLYCGTATIGLYTADCVKSVTGIEIVSQAVENAKENARENGIANARFYCGAAEDTAPRLIERGISADCVILDPPRKGCDKALIEKIASLSPRTVIYVSCDCATAARDAALFAKLGYRLCSVKAFDQFPQTCHVETVVLLSQLKQKPDDYINVTIELDDMDITSAETKATYDEIKKYVAEHNAGMKVSNLYISQVKRKCGIEVGKNYNLPKNEDSRQPQCPEDKESAIVEALKHFKMNS